MQCSVTRLSIPSMVRTRTVFPKSGEYRLLERLSGTRCWQSSSASRSRGSSGRHKGLHRFQQHHRGGSGGAVLRFASLKRKAHTTQRFSSLDSSISTTSTMQSASRATAADDASHLSWQATRALFVASAVPMVRKETKCLYEKGAICFDSHRFSMRFLFSPGGLWIHG